MGGEAVRAFACLLSFIDIRGYSIEDKEEGGSGVFCWNTGAY
jgi:hypothetical protein